MKIKITITILLFLGLATLFIIDPVFSRNVKFADYSVDYEWRIFNNSYCNIKTSDHCFTNATNKANAEIRLYRKLIENYKGQKIIKEKLESVVKTTYIFGMTYSDLTRSSVVKFDSIVKYKDQIFMDIALK